MEDVIAENDIKSAVCGKDIICTDSLPKEILPDFEEYQITAEIMKKAKKLLLLWKRLAENTDIPMQIMRKYTPHQAVTATTLTF